MANAATPSRRFARPSPVRVYWLARCEGFQLRCRDGTNGVVEEILFDASNSEAEALVVRVGRLVRRSVVVPTERVDAVAPFEEMLLGPGLKPHRRRALPQAHRKLGRSIARATAACARGTMRLLLAALRAGLAVLGRLVRLVQVVVPHLLQVSASAAVSATRGAYAAWRRVEPHLAAATRSAVVGIRSGARAAALLALAAAHWSARAARHAGPRSARVFRKLVAEIDSHASAIRAVGGGASRVPTPRRRAGRNRKTTSPS